MAGMLIGGTLPLGAFAASAAQQAPGYYPSFTPDTSHITASINNSALIAVKNSELSQSLAKYDSGVLLSTKQISSMTLLLKRSPEKQQQFQSYLSELTNPNSPYFHHWLTTKQIGTMFGPSSTDLAKVTQWLTSQGMSVKRVTPDGMTIRFAGTAAAVNQAFHVQLHSFNVNGEAHFGHLAAQQIPTALTPVVDRVVSLNNFFPKPQHTDVGVVSRNKQTGKWQTASRTGATPQFTVPGGTVDTNTTYDVAPADFNQIYNVNPLWNRGTPNRGAGQTIVVLERTDVNPADIAAFRAAFLPADAKGTVTYVHPDDGLGDGPCPDPGMNGDEGEAALDAEWAGAAAPDANIEVASCADSGTSFGPFTAAATLLEPGIHGVGTLPPPIWSLSYGACELEDSGDAYLADVFWSEAAAQGVTVFVSTGDAGSAGCDQGALFAATYGSAVNGMASSTSDVAVGGTDFNDFNNYGQYWAPTNLALDQSALGYIPEQTWNDSCASSQLDALLGYSNGLTACNDSSGRGQDFLSIGGGGGGASTLYTQPEWQIGVYGSVNHNSRTLPDVSLFAANGLYGHALVYCMSDANENGTACDYTNPDDVYYNSAGGTSFAAPAMAGIQALINQATGGPNGNISPTLYGVASKEYGTNGSPNNAMLASCNSSNGANVGSQCVFNDVTVGDIIQPCWAGSINCYSGSSGSNQFGTTVGGTGSSLTLLPAWQTNVGYDMATGLGSINAANLVDAVVKYLQPIQHTGYAAPYDFLSYSEFANDGYSDIALVDPVKGTLASLAMKGSVVMYSVPQQIAPGYSIGAEGANLVPQFVPLGLKSGAMAWTGPDNRLYLWFSDALGGYFPYSVASYPAGWKLLGEGVNDSSGTQQLFWFNATTSQFGWWTLGVDGNYNPIVQTISPLTTVAPGYVPTLADVDGDGYTDIVWTSTANNSVYVWISNHNGGYVAHSIADHPAGFTLFGAGDINGDGKTDLIWTNPATNQMAWWLMNGFTVTDQETRSVPPGYTMASIADYNGDGLADILWAGTAGDAYEWQSTGSGFQSFRVADPSGNPLVIPAGAQVQVNRLQGSTFVPSP
ncbi:protease pro-enzyme activation domain-containing protein [Rhodanobacter sp. C01]|uniref:protease pro-enzyme activation domain-containing protein n=1 Tax=Rhodanobacter sp. C01 TaxID=1945856 RepID=UPI001C2B7E2A|nr:protease pro-enzyme activation domain-containing protein [Rhodanobacter sp. C01]